MSYLRSPRIHFAGRFQADVSTVNNDVRHFDTQGFSGDYQTPMEVRDEAIVKFNGYWNPEGTGAWRLLSCKVTSAVLDGRVFTSPEEDPVIGLAIGGSANRVAAKLVDLDPQQQMVSQIWGLAVRLTSENGEAAFSGEFKVAPFCDLWLRQQKSVHLFDQHMAAAYQSVLSDVEWGQYPESSCLTALRAQTMEGKLSIRFNVFGYDRTPGAPDYGTGALIGTIGPAEVDGPVHFVMGRHLTAGVVPSQDGFSFLPANQVFNIQAVVDEPAMTVVADFGNALPIVDSSGELEDIGTLAFGVLKESGTPQGASVQPSQIAILGSIPYRDERWLFKTAGIQEFRLAGNPVAMGLIKDHPLAVVRVDEGGQCTVLNRETADGLYVRADELVFRLDPGHSEKINFYASRYGTPIAATIAVRPDMGLMGGKGTGADIPGTVPVVNTPEGAIQFDNVFNTLASGYGTITLSAAEGGPGNPRGYLDGQLYGITYQFKDLPPGYIANPLDSISILAWDQFAIPDQPTWHEHIQPILLQYANLYPVMSRRLVDLSDYNSVVANARIVRLSFSLPISDPNSMPVTRDLSANKRATILKWLDSKDPGTGLPPKGQVVTLSPRPGGSVETETNEPDIGSKAGFVRQALKARQDNHA